MRSVADELRRKTRESEQLLTSDERLQRAFQLGDDDLAAYARARGISVSLARTEIVQRRRIGRRPSRAADTAQS